MFIRCFALMYKLTSDFDYNSSFCNAYPLDTGAVVIKISQNEHLQGKYQKRCVLFFPSWANGLPSVVMASMIARFRGPTLGPSGADRAQVGPTLAPWTLLSGILGNVSGRDVDSSVTLRATDTTKFQVLHINKNLQRAYIPRVGHPEKLTQEGVLVIYHVYFHHTSSWLMCHSILNYGWDFNWSKVFIILKYIFLISTLHFLQLSYFYWSIFLFVQLVGQHQGI